ncbi:helix-turn-helix domain-containing protein [Methanosphaera sp.]|jgi:transcriptional regulator with XRE-family HTH domain|uniref:helix-turn-helix domain-containing protein n=1 Tax=Methanosphaera sp. TaxID=2666342 RepID=UPI003D8B9A18
MTIGNRLKKLRENNNFTQKQIAEYLDYDQSYITKLEKDEKILTVYALEELSDLYNCPEEYILDGEGTYTKPCYEYNTNTKNLEISTIAKMNKILRNLNFLSEITKDIDDTPSN